MKADIDPRFEVHIIRLTPEDDLDLDTFDAEAPVYYQIELLGTDESTDGYAADEDEALAAARADIEGWAV